MLLQSQGHSISWSAIGKPSVGEVYNGKKQRHRGSGRGGPLSSTLTFRTLKLEYECLEGGVAQPKANMDEVDKRPTGQACELRRYQWSAHRAHAPGSMQDAHLSRCVLGEAGEERIGACVLKRRHC